MLRIEAMADGIMKYEGWEPKSRSYRNRNPGNLRDSPLKSGMDESGYAIFTGLIRGYQALLNDLLDKVMGKSKHHFTPDSTLQELFDVYAPRLDKNNPGEYCLFVCDWMTKALGWRFTPASRLQPLLYGLVPTGVGLLEE